MKIILIGSVPPPYHGANVYFHSLLHSRIRDVYSIYHIDTSDSRSIDNIGKFDFTNVYVALRSVFLHGFTLLSKRPDIVYIPVAAAFLPYIRDGLFIMLTKLFSRAKIIVHLQSGNYFRTLFYDRSNRFVRWFVRRTLSYVHTAIVLGEGLRGVFDGLVSNVRVVPNAAPVNGTHNKVHNKNGDKPDDIVIGYLGNLIESKGVLDVIEAARDVIQKYPDVTFRFAGAWFDQEPETKEKAVRMTDRYGLNGHIRFSGMIRNGEKEKFLAETSIFVFPSWYPCEGLPLVIVEAMAAGLPVVSTKKTGVIDEVVVDGETGILVEQKSPRQIAEALIYLIEHPGVRKSMGDAGKRRFEKLYTIDKNVDKMMEIFENVHGKGG